MGAGPCHLIVDKEGEHVFSPRNYGGGSVVVLPIDEKGRLGEPTDFIQHKGKSKNPSRQEGPHAHCVALDAANRFAFVCDLGLDKVMIYKYDARGGQTDAERSAGGQAPPRQRAASHRFHAGRPIRLRY